MPIRSVILGIGNKSTQFTGKLISELSKSPPGHGVVAVGIYDNGTGVAGGKVRRKIQRLAKGLHIDDISVAPRVVADSSEPKLDDLVRMRHSALDYAPTSLLLIIDSEFLRSDEFAEVFRQMRVMGVQLAMTAICFSGNEQEDQHAYDVLQRYTQPDRLNNNAPILEAAFIVRTDSPLESAVGGEDTQYALLAKSLAGIWTAPLYRNYNPDFAAQVTRMREPGTAPSGDGTSNSGKTFIGLALKTQGLSMEKQNAGFFGRVLYPILRHTTWGITKEQAADTIVALTRSLLEDSPQFTTVAPLTRQGIPVYDLPISVNLIVPFRSSSGKFDDVANLVQLKLTHPEKFQPSGAQYRFAGAPGPSTPAQPGSQGNQGNMPGTVRGYTVVVRSIIEGRGVDLSSKAIGVNKGKYYFQVCLLFAIDRDHIAL